MSKLDGSKLSLGLGNKHPPSLPTPPRLLLYRHLSPQAQHSTRFYIRLERPWDGWDRAPQTQLQPSRAREETLESRDSPQHGPLWFVCVCGGGGGVGKCSFVEVGCAIPYSETLCISDSLYFCISHSILVGKKRRTKRVFNYCHPKINVRGTTKCKILKAIHNIRFKKILCNLWARFSQFSYFVKIIKKTNNNPRKFATLKIQSDVILFIVII